MLEDLRQARRGEHTSSLGALIAAKLGGMAAVLCDRVDAVLLTGGMVRTHEVVDSLREHIKRIAPIHVFPGEEELQALAEGALRVLRGEELARNYI